MGERMTIGRDEVLHVAKLAELAVAETELDRLVEQMNRIVDYVAQLDEVRSDRVPDAFLPGPPTVRLRDDVEGPMPLARPPVALAPEFEDGFFVVPRHGAMEDT
jgi:aspartyl-tRNA(Asn)/glutamyl-tRNA(Gln) amidotransferase subunit C